MKQTLLAKMKQGPVYLHNTFEDVFVRTTPNSKYFAKIKGRPEFEIRSSTNLFQETLDEGKEVSKKQYDKATI